MNDIEMWDALDSLHKDPSRKSISWVPGATIFLTRSGSQAYGTSTPTSDTDYKGICVEPPEYYMGFDVKFEQADFRKPDACIFSLRKFFKLAAECNPNIIEMLYTDESDWLRGNNLFVHQLHAGREKFLSRKAQHTFSGYAMSQLKRIKHHYDWHRRPPEKEPLREDFGLPRITLCPMDQLVAAEAAIRKNVDALFNLDFDLPPAETIEFEEHRQALIDRVAEVCGQAGTTVPAVIGKGLGFDTNFLELLDRERAYKAKRTDWEAFQKWKRERNPARAELEGKFGYDTKHAMHLVRLLRMGREILQGKGVLVKRPDAEELLAIRRGSMTYEELVAYAEGQDAAMRKDAETSPLPHGPNRQALNRACIQLYEEFNR